MSKREKVDDFIVKGVSGEWKVVIGLEIHAQVSTNAKLFSKSSSAFSEVPNVNVSRVDAAIPGSLPVLNRGAIEKAVLTGLALNGEIQLYSVFDRKHYYYPDLPFGYQITQFYYPLMKGGYINVKMPSGDVHQVIIRSIHLEQDAGKSIHDVGFEFSYVDLNRAGVPLMEIVTDACITSPEMAADFIKNLRSILRYVGSCDGNMESGSMRCDANVSVMPRGSQTMGTRCEVKNLNSINNIVRAIEYEATRQVEVIEGGGKINQETRLFDADKGITEKMRDKEDSSDYCYFPDPDLAPLVLLKEDVERYQKMLPELHWQKLDRYMKDFELNADEAYILAEDKETAEYFEKVALLSEAKNACNWILVELFGRLNKNGIAFSDNPIPAGHLASLINLIKNNTISGKIAKQVFDEMFVDTKLSPEQIVSKLGLTQISDASEIITVIKKILADNQDKVVEYKNGKDKLLMFFVGQVMKEMKGRANPTMLNDILLKELKS